MEVEAAERFQAELDLLLAMYPDSLSFSAKGRELKYSHWGDESGTKSPAVLTLRLPDTYPLVGFPEVVSATGHYKEYLRSPTQAVFSSTEAPPGEEVLDVLLLAFRDLVSSREGPSQKATVQATRETESQGMSELANRTVIIWLHHLLNTNKRKLALNPSMAASRVSGVTKPGYPGVLVFSGETSAIESHVLELRNQRWQAFQIRYDTDNEGVPSEIWRFKHGVGISEVESMSDVAQSIVDPQHREVFLNSIGVK
ncbi:hypothetical protein F5B22DRAFT_594411 [Xylaria bambusicola]|uniref:uncharacterized protein n=1 Tax=Xylaria bambusicola TaxID=326684 RepID=UPI0020074C9F|nr:uncharacterized protein F5B22DRAFT_594411 [Xylaria bambusicola]KAI0521868.1 hypothetical protein F5B22DRAFT_594411 [Xylaria bambusicola]